VLVRFDHVASVIVNANHSIGDQLRNLRQRWVRRTLRVRNLRQDFVKENFMTILLIVVVPRIALRGAPSAASERVNLLQNTPRAHSPTW
jgi:hypothetical protein